MDKPLARLRILDFCIALFSPGHGHPRFGKDIDGSAGLVLSSAPPLRQHLQSLTRSIPLEHPMTDELSTAQRIEHLMKAYVEPLNSADADGIAACFCQDADHYFPAQPKRTGQPRLARTLRTSFFSGKSLGRLIRYSLMLTVVPQCLNGRCLNQKPRNILSAE